MIDKKAENLNMLIEEEAKQGGIRDVVLKEEQHETPLKVERLSDHMLALTVHRGQLQDVLGAFRAKGVEPFRNEDTDCSFGEYELLYIASETPDIDILRYQVILDNIA